MTKKENFTTHGMDIIDLNPDQLDSLRELGNIGSRNAVTALSKLINKKINMSLSHVSIIPFWKITSIVDDLKAEVFAICSVITGDTNLSIFQFFTKDSVINMIETLSDKHPQNFERITDIAQFDDYTLSIVQEIGNILTAHYASALANLMSIKLIPEVPAVAFDTLETILNSIVSKYSNSTDHLIIINTEIQIEELSLYGHFCFIPDLTTLQKLFNAIKIDFVIRK